MGATIAGRIYARVVRAATGGINQRAALLSSELSRPAEVRYRASARALGALIHVNRSIAVTDRLTRVAPRRVSAVHGAVLASLRAAGPPSVSQARRGGPSPVTDH